MGLFSKGIELKKEFFVQCLDMDKSALCNFRERQGFKIKISNNSSSIVVTAELGGYFKYMHIYNDFYNNGTRECRFFFVGFELKELLDFFKQNFVSVPTDLKYIVSQGPPRTIASFYPPSVFLADGDILTQDQFNNSTYSLKVIPSSKTLKL